jgi:hypothetical protein
MPEVALNVPFDANEIKDIATAEFRKRLDGLGPLQGMKEYASFHLDFEVKIRLSRVGAIVAATDTLAWGSVEKSHPSAQDLDLVAEEEKIRNSTFQSKDPNEERIEREMPLTVETTDGKGGKTRKKVKIKGEVVTKGKKGK